MIGILTLSTFLDLIFEGETPEEENSKDVADEPDVDDDETEMQQEDKEAEQGTFLQKSLFNLLMRYEIYYKYLNTTRYLAPSSTFRDV